MIVKTKPQLRQALAKILDKGRQIRTIAIPGSAEDKTLEELTGIASEALGDPSMADLAAMLQGKEPPSVRNNGGKSKKKKETAA